MNAHKKGKTLAVKQQKRVAKANKKAKSKAKSKAKRALVKDSKMDLGDGAMADGIPFPSEPLVAPSPLCDGAMVDDTSAAPIRARTPKKTASTVPVAVKLATPTAKRVTRVTRATTASKKK